MGHDAATTTESNEQEDKELVQNNNVNDDDEEVDKLAEAFQEKTKVTTTDTPKEEEDDDEKEQPPPSSASSVAASSSSAAARDIDADDDDAPEELKQVAEWIRSGQAKRILVVTGAGVSVAAGIPDFRSPGTGLYDNLAKYKLPYPEAVFDIRFYAKNPQPFIQLASELWPALGADDNIAEHVKYKPTYTHCFLSLLAEKNLLLRVYTQNIDGLDHMAQVPEELLMECHGNFRTASCIRCQTRSLDIQVVQQMIVHDRQVPRCHKCQGFQKPDIVFFGEGLPSNFYKLLGQDLPVADCCFILGTSLQVAPVSLIPSRVRRSSSPLVCKRVLLNREWVGDDCLPGFGMNPQEDVFHLGDCDDSIQILARLLGWQDELQQRYNAIHHPNNNNNDDNCKTNGEK